MFSPGSLGAFCLEIADFSVLFIFVIEKGYNRPMVVVLAASNKMHYYNILRGDMWLALE